MSEYFEFTVNKKHVAKEREKARELKKSSWWRTKISAGLCDYCGGQFPQEQLTMDHIVPLARGGTSSKGNLAVSCKSCNNEKRLATPAERLLSQLQGLGTADEGTPSE